MKVSIDYIEDEWEVILLLTKPQERRLRSRITDLTAELVRDGWTKDIPIADLTPEQRGQIELIASLDADLDADAKIRKENAGRIKTATWELRAPTMGAQESVRRDIGWSAEDAEDGEGNAKSERVLWEKAPDLCYAALVPSLSTDTGQAATDGRIEFAVVLRSICEEMLFPSLTARRKAFTAGLPSR